MASLNPLRKIVHSPASSTSVSATGWSNAFGTNGFPVICAVASAADSVIVMMKSVAANPSRIRTNALPFHRGSSSSSIAMLPCPFGLAAATCR
jgi:hypothetical protein